MITIIKIEPFENGSHDNLTGDYETIPDGWAVVPDNIKTPNFPFGEITIEEINGVMTVTKWVAVTIPEPTPEPEHEQTEVEQSRVDRILEVLYKAGKLTEQEYKDILAIE